MVRMNPLNTIKEWYEAKFREQVFSKFNQELLLGELGAFVGGAGVGTIASTVTASPSWISTASAIGDIGGYGIGYGVSSYIHRKEKYSQNKGLFLKDMSKVGVSGIVLAPFYYAIRYSLNVYLLKENYEPWYASVAAQVPATIFYFATMNVLGKIFDFRE